MVVNSKGDLGSLQNKPNSVMLASDNASSSLLNVLTIMTGPKISSVYARDVVGTFSSIVGSTQ